MRIQKALIRVNRKAPLMLLLNGYDFLTHYMIVIRQQWRGTENGNDYLLNVLQNVVFVLCWVLFSETKALSFLSTISLAFACLRSFLLHHFYNIISTTKTDIILDVQLHPLAGNIIYQFGKLDHLICASIRFITLHVQHLKVFFASFPCNHSPFYHVTSNSNEIFTTFFHIKVSRKKNCHRKCMWS